MNKISYRAKLKRNNRFRAQISSTSSQDTSDDEIQQLDGNNGTYKDGHHENLLLSDSSFSATETKIFSP